MLSHMFLYISHWFEIWDTENCETINICNTQYFQLQGIRDKTMTKEDPYPLETHNPVGETLIRQV